MEMANAAALLLLGSPGQPGLVAVGQAAIVAPLELPLAGVAELPRLVCSLVSGPDLNRLKRAPITMMGALEGRRRGYEGGVVFEKTKRRRL
jgi:hypothetical protein